MEELKKKLAEVYALMTPENIAGLSEEEIASLQKMLSTIQEAIEEESGYDENELDDADEDE